MNFTLCLHSGNLNIAMENGPFEDVFPIKTGEYSIAMLVCQSFSV